MYGTAQGGRKISKDQKDLLERLQLIPSQIKRVPERYLTIPGWAILCRPIGDGSSPGFLPGSWKEESGARRGLVRNRTRELARRGDYYNLVNDSGVSFMGQPLNHSTSSDRS
jgi:hypothetical protein